MRQDTAQVLAELRTIDRKAHKNAMGAHRELAVIEQKVGAEEVLWVQSAMYIAGAHGEMEVSNVHGGLVALTTSRLMFEGRSGSAQWSYRDMSAVTDGRALGGVWKMRIEQRNGNAIWFASGFKKASGTLAGTLAALISEAARYAMAADEPRGDASSTADELLKLADLHQQGVLSEDEFAAAKAQLLHI